MPISDVFFIRGRGVVVTGTVEEGSVRVGDEVRVGGRSLRVDGIEAFRRILDEANAGDIVGILFKSLDREDVQRGEVITAGAADSVAAGASDSVAAGASAEIGVAGGFEAAAAAPAAGGAPPGRDARFSAVENQRAQFLSMREAGLMTTSQVDESLRGLVFAAGGRQWLLRHDDDTWYSSVDGEDWRHDTPPAQ